MRSVQKKTRIECLECGNLSKDNLVSGLSLINQIFVYKEDQDEAHRNLTDTVAGKNFGQNYWFVTDAEENAIGISGLYFGERGDRDNGIIWLGWFGVHPDFRKRHLASLLLDFTIDKAIKQGFKTMKIYTSTDETEQAANQLYQKHGFLQFTSSDDGEIVYYQKQLTQ